MRSRCPPCRVAPSSSPRRVVRATRRDVDTTTLDNCRALVLDATFRPLDIINWHRAVVLDVFKSAEVLVYYDCCVKTVRQDYPVPAVIRTEFLMKGTAKRNIPLTRRNVLKRDRNTCVYCGSRQDLTLDHIIPLSKGGENSWENVVTACRRCNGRKGNRTLEQMGWKLKTAPKRPPAFDLRFIIDLPLNSPKEWHEYITNW